MKHGDLETPRPFRPYLRIRSRLIFKDILHDQISLGGEYPPVITPIASPQLFVLSPTILHFDLTHFLSANSLVILISTSQGSHSTHFQCAQRVLLLQVLRHTIHRLHFRHILKAKILPFYHTILHTFFGPVPSMNHMIIIVCSIHYRTINIYCRTHKNLPQPKTRRINYTYFIVD